MPVFFLRLVGIFALFYQLLDFLPGFSQSGRVLFVDLLDQGVQHFDSCGCCLGYQFADASKRFVQFCHGDPGSAGCGDDLGVQVFAVPATGAYDHGPTLRFLPPLDLLEGVAHGVQLIGAVVFFPKVAFLVLVRPEDATKVVDRLRGHNILHFADVVHVLVSAAIAAWACSGVR